MGAVTIPTNLFDDLPSHLPDELVTSLLEAADVRIERIVSHGHASPDGFLYDQEQHEWVVVLTGDEAWRFHQHPGAQEAPGRVDDAG